MWSTQASDGRNRMSVVWRPSKRKSMVAIEAERMLAMSTALTIAKVQWVFPVQRSRAAYRLTNDWKQIDLAVVLSVAISGAVGGVYTISTASSLASLPSLLSLLRFSVTCFLVVSWKHPYLLPMPPLTANFRV